MNVFYVPQSFGSLEIQLDENESNHCIKVLRLRIDEIITIVDGNGGLFSAKIIDAHHKKCRVAIIESSNSPKPEPFLHIAIAPTKNIDRFEWFIEKAIEIGVGMITPLHCEKSERKLVNNERLDKIVVAAMKQSLNLHKTVLNPMTSLTDVLKNMKQTQTFIAHCEDSDKTALKNACKPKLDTLILIGPEGDFSVKEIAFAMKNGCTAISLGDTRLRTETAGIVACHSFCFVNQS
jgi:16S rRNA (uracil1498-N3)-methyltransferase